MSSFFLPSLLSHPPKYIKFKNMVDISPANILLSEDMINHDDNNHSFAKFDHSAFGKDNKYNFKSYNKNKGGHRMIICKYRGCGMKFSRSEHYIRHTRKHTGEKPYSCVYPNCKSVFSRFDNMIQHSQTHISHGKMFGACFITNEKTSTRGKRRPKGIKTMDTFYKEKISNNAAQRGTCNTTADEQKIYQDYQYFSLTLKPILVEDNKNPQEKTKKPPKIQKNVFKIVNYNNSADANPGGSTQEQKERRYSDLDSEITLFH